MKKTLTKISAALLLVSMFPLGVSCGGKDVADGATDLEIFVLDAGYGTAWAKEIGEAFKSEAWVQEKYPNLTVSVRSNDQKTYAASMLSTPKENTFDILFGQGLSSNYGSDTIADLTECVYNAEVPGEGGTLYKDKMISSVRDSYYYTDIVDDSKNGYYAVPWQGGMSGILYNEDVLKANGVAVPRTTDEFIAACQTITDKNKNKADSDATKAYAIIQSSEAPYWDMYYFATPWAQYDGVQGYDNFYNGIYDNGDGTLERSNKIFQMKGRLRALEYFEEVMDYSKGYISPRSFSDTFMIAQSAFLKGAAAFHVNGDYFTREMYDTYNRMPEKDRDVINIMRSPVISAITEVLPDKSVENDAELSALIKAIDECNDALSGEGYSVTQDDYDRVKEARFIVGTGGGVQGLIPSYATAKEVAIDYLRYMATDKALGIYVKATNGCTLDFHYDVKDKDMELYNSLMPLNKTKIDYFSAGNEEPHILRNKSSYPLNQYGELKPFIATDIWTVFTAQKNEYTAQGYFDETIKYWSTDTFNKALSASGLS